MPELTGEPLRHFRHELRTPVNHIAGFADVLIDDADDNNRPQLKPPAGSIRDAGYALLEVMQKSLDERESVDRAVLETLETELNPRFVYLRVLCEGLKNSGAYAQGEEPLEYLEIIGRAICQMETTLSNQMKACGD